MTQRALVAGSETDRSSRAMRSLNFVAAMRRVRLAFRPAIGRWRRASLWDRLAAAALGVAAILVFATFTDYGVTWDEDVHNWYGILALDYYLSLFADKRALHWLDLYNYGAAFDMMAAALNRFSSLGGYETLHLLHGLVGVLGL